MAKKSLSTKEKLLKAATELFLKKGVDRVGVREIAAKANINLSLMNYYFKSKENLLEHIFESLIQYKSAKLQEVLEAETPLEHKIKQYVEVYIDMLMENPLLVSFFMTILHRNPEKIISMVSAKSLYNSEVFCNQIEVEAKAGRIRFTDPEQFFISMVSLIIFPIAIKDLIIDRNSFSAQQFKQFILERKEVVPDMLISYLFVR
jgi:AcrR family transcriptional regulator